MTTTISDYMHTNLVCLDSADSALDAARSMRDSAVGDVLVTQDGNLCGIVTDRDLVVRCLAESRDPANTPLLDLCSRKLVTLSPDDEPQRAVQQMRDNAVRRLPVVSGGRAVGIVSLGDLAEELDRESALGGISAAPPNH